MGKDPDEVAALTAVDLVGTWSRASAQEQVEPAAPAELQLLAATPTSGRYVGRKGEGEPAFLLWDAGSWYFEPPDRLTMSTATDALEAYRVELRNDELVVDLGPSQVLYRRTTGSSSGAADLATRGTSHHEEREQPEPT